MNAVKRDKPLSRSVLCIRSNGSEDLEPRKVYQILPGQAAAREGYTRVVDESGEDYLYPAEYFAPLKLPASIAQELVSDSKKSMQSSSGIRQRSSRRLRAARR